MRARRLAPFVAVLGLAALTGCASTTVVKDPGPDDCGFRYYRSKPYLMVSPAGAKDAAPEPHKYTIEVRYLPDFTEEYSVHIKPGLGINNTSLTFNEAGILLAANVNIDSQADELVTAVSGAIPNITDLVGGPGTQRRTFDPITVTGRNVPIGLYEAVLGRGPDGAKRLYGWRYVGFVPFAKCPIDASGAECATCDQLDLYALVWSGEGMVFAKLEEVARTAVVLKTKALEESQPQPQAVPKPKVKPKKKKDQKVEEEEQASANWAPAGGAFLPRRGPAAVAASTGTAQD